tara:strand:- start:30699 stop:31598 length:900 start_codon:yes stop_codon:yes gene_type:complete
MSNIGFIGVGKMGAPMVGNLVSAGHTVTVFDVSSHALEEAKKRGGRIAKNLTDVASSKEVVITMLPAGPEVKAIYLGPKGITSIVDSATLLIDCSTIDVQSSEVIHSSARSAGIDMVDAPVSGGVSGAEAGGLTFMVGGTEAAYNNAFPILSDMGKAIIHAGKEGRGQAAKICNNMLLGISMIAVSEAFALADALGLSRQTLFDISSKATGRCWALNDYCPVPGPVPNSPANRNYEPGFTASMMLKDLALSQLAADAFRVKTELGSDAEALYSKFCKAGNGELDFSAIFTTVGKEGEVK